MFSLFSRFSSGISEKDQAVINEVKVVKSKVAASDLLVFQMRQEEPANRAAQSKTLHLLAQEKASYEQAERKFQINFGDVMVVKATCETREKEANKTFHKNRKLLNKCNREQIGLETFLNECKTEEKSRKLNQAASQRTSESIREEINKANILLQSTVQEHELKDACILEEMEQLSRGVKAAEEKAKKVREEKKTQAEKREKADVKEIRDLNRRIKTMRSDIAERKRQ
jgi:hypothetical protein